MHLAYWSIAQTKDRETEASGIGWELFKNYLIAKEKWKPDYFLYENNVSADWKIKAQIKHEFGVTDAEQIDMFIADTGVRYTEINSALLSAQNRARFYVTNFGDIEQPKDRGIPLKDILESGFGIQTAEEKSRTIKAQYNNSAEANFVTNGQFQATGVAEPIRVGSMPRPNGELSESQGFRVYGTDGKSVAIKGESGGAGGKTGLYAISEEYFKGAEDSSLVGMTTDGEGKYRNGSQPSQQYRVFSSEEKSQTLNTMANENYMVFANGKEYPVYEVKDGKITIKGKQYPIRLVDGYYIIRKLTVRECMRLQTVPEWYVFPVSDSQAYKMLGNGWTVEVIKHLLSHIPNIKNEEVEVLSMYDGMACGMIALKEMGVKVVKYTAYEIDKYAIQTATYNFPEIIEKGDAFQVREEGWAP